MTSKNCTKCQELKPLSAYGKLIARKSGYSNVCKKCHNYINLCASRTKYGRISRIYSDQKARSKKHGYNPPSYSLNDLIILLLSKDLFNNIYCSWVASGYDKWESPSIDRIDDYKGYSLDNIQIMTWKENYDKGNSDAFNGLNNKRNIKVNQFSINGGLIKEHYSLHSAGREIGIGAQGVWNCCNGLTKSSGGFVWRYAPFQQTIKGET